MRIRYGWELALAALLVIEIVAFGAINLRMLDLNMLLFSTSDFICSLQMAGVPNQVSTALSGALFIVVVVGRSVSLHRQQIKEWLARRANNPLP
ncbi:hypothetical protein HVV74_10880 [Escherichia coli]|nr:hypothetical protein [Escherichia coli]EHX4452993.1 hypothetical protein [Escherichia coli]QMQ22989.1 hypothetical protein HVV74_10880 [Escherichia coli]